MAIRDLFFRITAKDETAAGFAAVKRNMKDVEGASRALRDRLGDVGRSARNIGAGLTVGITAPILLGLRQTLSLYQVQEKAEAQVAQAIRQTGAAAGFTAAQLFEQASALQELSAVGDETILADVTAQLLTFGNISGDVFRRAQVAALDLSATLGSNLRSQTIQLGKALNDPVKGISALGKAGIQFSEDQKGVIASLVETGRVAEAQGVILDEIAAFYGGQAAASAGTLTGQITALNNAWGDLLEQFGAIVAELLPPLIAGLRDVIAGFQATPEPVKRLIVAGAGLAAIVGPLTAALGLLAIGIGAVGAPVAVAIAAITALTAAAAAFWPEIEAGAAVVAESVAAIVAGVEAAGRAAVETVRAWVAEVWAVIRDGFGRVADFVDGVARRITDAWAFVYDEVVGNSSVPDLVDGVLAEFKRLDRGAAGQAEATAETVAGTFEELRDTVAGALADVVRSGDFTARGLAGVVRGIGAQVAGRASSRAIDLLSGLAVNAIGGALGGGGATSAPGGLPRFNEGADFTVGGRGGIDRNLVAFMATRGERVTVTPKGGGAGPAVNVTIQTPNPEAFAASRGQVSATIARAVARGQRNL